MHHSFSQSLSNQWLSTYYVCYCVLWLDILKNRFNKIWKSATHRLSIFHINVLFLFKNWFAYQHLKMGISHFKNGISSFWNIRGSAIWADILSSSGAELSNCWPSDGSCMPRFDRSCMPHGLQELSSCWPSWWVLYAPRGCRSWVAADPWWVLYAPRCSLTVSWHHPTPSFSYITCQVPVGTLSLWPLDVAKKLLLFVNNL